MGPETEEIEGGITAVQGIRAGGVHCGIKKEGEDLALTVSEGEVSVAAVFTTNAVKAAPVLLSRELLEKGSPRAVVANSGNANCYTGERGLKDAREMSDRTAGCLGLEKGSVLVASTGSIGHYLPMDKIRAGIDRLAREISPQGGEEAARGIMTTDTVPKTAALQYSCDGRSISIGGMTKGAGMIFPRMATMLAFIATDAAVGEKELQNALVKAVNKSFNRITIDGDTSTNDTVFLMANGLAGNPVLKKGEGALAAFEEALERLCVQLAKKIVLDGEGATKFVEVTVKEAVSEEDALAVARAVANSPLVKTAWYGQDPNWGRIMAAAGSTGRALELSKMMLYFNDIKIVENGLKAEGDWLGAAEKALKEKNLKVTLHLGAGDAESKVWTTDLTEEYIRINAHYHT